MMEFPKSGTHCTLTSCKQLDFLPFTCEHCKCVFCKDHFHALSHSCSKFINNVVTIVEKSTSYRCTHYSCNQTSPVEMPCVKCKMHFCLAHRYHGCLELSEEEKTKEMKKWDMPKQGFLVAKSAVDREIKEKLKNSKNSAMAIKVQLMKLKGHSVGSQGIPTVDRRYFLVYYPVSSKNAGSSKGAFVSISWTIGKAIDSISHLLGIPNSNNVTTCEKLRMFHYDTGFIVADQMDTLLAELFKSNKLIDGQSIIFEYCNNNQVYCSRYSSKS